MSATEPAPRRILIPFLTRATAYAGEFDAGERIALAAMLATPFALYVDYRTGAALVDDLVHYRPIGEAAGRLVSYHQLFGWTQIVWLAAGVGMAAFRGTRDAFRSLPVVLLAALLALILGVTLARGGIDRTTVVALGATLLPLIAMTAVLTRLSMRQEIRRLLVTIFITECATIVALSFAKKALAGRADGRLEAFAFGPAPELGLVLAAVVLLAFAAAGPVPLRALLVAVTGSGLLLTETRGAILAAVAGGIVLGLLLPKARLIGAGLLGSVLLVFALTTSRSLSFSDIGTTYRRRHLEHHWELFEREPLFGYGVNASGIDEFRAAHSVFLGMANAAGVLAALLLALVWIGPVLYRLARGAAGPVEAVAVAVVTATLVGWNTTGTEVLIYNPPTNLLPLVLAVGLLQPPVLGPRRA